MALMQTVDSSDLYNLACNMNLGKKFGYKGWRAIGEYLENLSADLGENIEIDIVAICCEYSMVESTEEFFMEFDHHMRGVDSPEEEKLETIEEFLQENTSLVICEDDLIIWKAF